MNKIARQVDIENLTLILKVPLEDGDNIKKGIRHALDPEEGHYGSKDLHYIGDEYDYVVNRREGHLEVIITGMSAVVRMNKYTSGPRIRTTAKSILSKSEAVTAIGEFDIREHYTTVAY